MRRLDNWLTAAVGILVCCTASQSVSQPNVTVDSGTNTTALHAHLAWTERDQDAGVRGLHNFSGQQAMLFPLRPARAVHIFMDGVFTDLDVAFVRGGRIVSVTRAVACLLNRPGTACPTYPSPGPADAVLELPAGSLTADSVGARIHPYALNAK